MHYRIPWVSDHAGDASTGRVVSESEAVLGWEKQTLDWSNDDDRCSQH